MPRALDVTEAVRVPARGLSIRSLRSSGPGGQAVNKLATKVVLRVDLDAIQGLSPAARERLRALARPRLDRDGRLVVASQASREQARNLEDAREKVRRLVLEALREPKPRRPTRVPAAVREARLQAKKRRGAVKRRRELAPEAE
jgi:ribosome-associated protein